MHKHVPPTAVIVQLSLLTTAFAAPPPETRGVDRRKRSDESQSGQQRRDWLAAGIYSSASGRLLPVGSKVRSDEEIFLAVDLREAAYLYILSQTDDEAPQVVYPKPELKDSDIRRKPGKYRIPGDGEEALFFFGEPSREAFIVVASHERMSQARLKRAVRALTPVTPPTRRASAGMSQQGAASGAAGMEARLGRLKSRPFEYSTRGVGRRPPLADGRQRVDIATKGSFSMVELWLDHRE